MALSIVLFVIYFCFMSCLFADFSEHSSVEKPPNLEQEIEQVVEDVGVASRREELGIEPIADKEIEALFEVAFAQPEIKPQQRSESLLPNWGIREFKKWGSQWNKKHPQQRIKAIANLTKPQWEEIYLQLVT